MLHAALWALDSGQRNYISVLREKMWFCLLIVFLCIYKFAYFCFLYVYCYCKI